MEKGDTVTIVISLGPEELSVPNLLGFALKDAKKILEKDGLVLGSVSYDYSEIYKEGTVINQNPVAGSGNIKKGDTVNVVVSKGQKPEEKPIEEEKPSDDDNSDQNNNNNNSNNNDSNNNNNNDGNNSNDNNSNNDDDANNGSDNNSDNTQNGNDNSGEQQTSNINNNDDDDND